MVWVASGSSVVVWWSGEALVEARLELTLPTL
jgi:hypothetical protein